MSQTKITGVPNGRVPVIKRIYERAGATSIDVTDNGNGTSDLLVTFPDEQDHTTFKAQVSSSKNV